MVKKIFLATPRGFCAGVDRAIEIVEKSLELYGKPVYVRHKIVHNEYVVKSLEDKGVVFVEELDEVPDESVVIFSAHGITPEIREDTEKMGLKAIDATCPLVTKVHLEAEKYDKEGYLIILIGHKGHQEVIGTMGYAKMNLIESQEDVNNLNIENPDKVVYLTQTTLSIDDTEEIVKALKKKFPSIVPKDDICYATQNRQNSVKELSKHCDYILVVGSKESSNSNRLVETARRLNIQSKLIPDKSYLDNHDLLANIETLGITSGASVPEILVEEVIQHIQEQFGQPPVETLEYLVENTNFSLPKELR
ncbi:MAG: 4-hydroxy-3-methylbut-2-enyl diphosphate reductase [DPANN group archaeon]|nr:4-hydroxy-3-methylbut-2-enyl diphosphate reductase [DPANN group archaeon]